MIFKFKSGKNIRMAVGSCIKGFSVDGERPISVSFTQTEVQCLITSPEYLKSVHATLVTPEE